MSILKDVSIVIPTKNRSSWCIRLLNYYSYLNFPGKIIFCDSSNSDHLDELKIYIESKNHRNVQHLPLPNESLHFALQYGIEVAKENTRYFVQSGDDDFFSIEGLINAAQFLSINLSYASCLGRSVIAGYISYGNKMEQQWLRPYGWPYSLTQHERNERVFQITNRYYNLEFSMRRTDTGFEIIRDVNTFLGRLSFEESTTAEYCSVIGIANSGKVKVLSKPFLLRIDHAGRPNRTKLEQNDLLTFRSLQIEKALNYHLHLQYPEQEGSVERKQLDVHYNNLKFKIEDRYIRRNSLRLRVSGIFKKLIAFASGSILKVLFQPFYRLYERSY